MRSRLIIIAGGSGSGKSTLAANLYHSYPSVFSVVHLDDYYKSFAEVPKFPDASPNPEHPDALRFNDVLRDIKLLSLGQSIAVLTKSELYNPGYDPKLHNKITYRIEPRPIVLLEGFLALAEPRIRALAYASFFLDMAIDASAQRRSRNKLPISSEYITSVLSPFHARYVEATREYAMQIIDVASKTQNEVLQAVLIDLRHRGLLKN
jgi:uridine kinase